MDDLEFRKFVNEFISKFKPLTPIDTGNLRSSVKFVFTSPSRAVVYVDTKQAPYMPYTNEPWISPRWNGKKNPHENWFENAVVEALEKTAESMKGTIRR